MSDLIISVSGLRGVVGESLTEEVAARYARAFAKTREGGAIVVARDGRPSGAELAEHVSGALAAAGRPVKTAGVAATPTVGVLVRAEGAAGGIQISASHNPAEYNGMKLFGPAGRVLTAAEGKRVLERYHSPGDSDAPDDLTAATAESLPHPHDEHLRLVLATVDAERIANRRYRVLLDANGGAGGALGRRLLERLGCAVTIVGERPGGGFAHTPEPVSENLQEIAAQVAAGEFDAGFCQDPDADRLAIIDAGGRFLGEEYTLALCLDHALRRRRGPVVANCATSRLSEDVARRHGVELFRSAVGEANVVALMQEKDAVYGGEGNGGPIDPRVVYVRDSFVGMAQVLDAMAAREMPVGELADELPRYAMIKTRVELPREKIPAAFDALARRFAGAAADRLDGLRLDWPDRWLLVRASNTEPIVRLIAEAKTGEAAEDIIREAGDVCLRV